MVEDADVLHAGALVGVLGQILLRAAEEEVFVALALEGIVEQGAEDPASLEEGERTGLTADEILEVGEFEFGVEGAGAGHDQGLRRGVGLALGAVAERADDLRPVGGEPGVHLFRDEGVGIVEQGDQMIELFGIDGHRARR